MLAPIARLQSGPEHGHDDHNDDEGDYLNYDDDDDNSDDDAVGGVDLCGGGGPSSSEFEPDIGLAALLPPSPPLPPLQEGAAMVRGPRL